MKFSFEILSHSKYLLVLIISFFSVVIYSLFFL